MKVGRPGAIAILLLATTVLVVGRYVDFPVTVAIIAGPSMAPTMNPGDLVILLKTGFDVGDVVMWCNTQWSCIVHRLVEFENGFVITKGDANTLTDPPVPIEMVKYKVVIHLPSPIWIPLYAALLIIAYKIDKRRESSE